MQLHLPAGTAGAGPADVAIGPDRPGWSWTSLRTVTLSPGAHTTFDTGDEELVVLPLAAGAATVHCDDLEFAVAAREGVFAGPGDFVYLPRAAQATLGADRGGRFALIGAVCTGRLTPRHVRASEVPVELRGAGNASRQVNNFCTPASFEADRLIAVEVLTPGGNWSSWPPHKHDEHRPGQESELEEIYYFELSRPEGLAWMRVAGTEHRPIAFDGRVAHGDVVLVPCGWHGPATVAPGADLYYLNVMAGPGPERAWCICDEPGYAHVRGDWPTTPIDPRLPMYGAARSGAG